MLKTEKLSRMWRKLGGYFGTTFTVMYAPKNIIFFVGGVWVLHNHGDDLAV